jgi:hypothetical protein
LKSLDGGFGKLASRPLEFIEYKGLIEMTEPRVMFPQMENYEKIIACREGSREDNMA